MEIILAIVVVSAVIFFGALISIGNERQRNAIDSLSQQITLWAMQDLRIKREKVAREVQVDDPLGWLNKTTAKVYGHDLNLQIVEVFDEPQALVCATGGSVIKVIFSVLSYREIQLMKRERRSHLSKYMSQNPLLSLPRNITPYEFSVLNGGLLFDLELPLVWEALTRRRAEQIERLWMYVIS